MLSMKTCFHCLKFSTLSFRRKDYTFSTNCWAAVKIILKQAPDFNRRNACKILCTARLEANTHFVCSVDFSVGSSVKGKRKGEESKTTVELKWVPRRNFWQQKLSVC